MLSSQTLLGSPPMFPDNPLLDSSLPPPPPPSTQLLQHEFTEAGLLETFADELEFKELLAVSERLYCQENVLFYDTITRLSSTATTSTTNEADNEDILWEIYKKYIVPGSEYELNLSPEVRKKIIDAFTTSTIEQQQQQQQINGQIFEKAKDEVFSMIFLNVYPVYLSRRHGRSTPSSTYNSTYYNATYNTNSLNNNNNTINPSVSSAMLKFSRTPSNILKRASAVSLKSWRKNVFTPLDSHDSPLGVTEAKRRGLRKQESCSDFSSPAVITRQMSLDYSSLSLERQETFDERSCYSVESQYMLPTLAANGGRSRGSIIRMDFTDNFNQNHDKHRTNNVFKRLIRKFKSLNIP